MDITVHAFDGTTCTVEVSPEDTSNVLRCKIAVAVGVPEESFHMHCGGGAVEDVRGLSAGDSIVLKRTKQYDAIAALHELGETELTGGRMVAIRDLKVATLFLDAEVAWAIPDKFQWKSRITTLDLSSTGSAITKIGDNFAADCANLETADFSGLSNVVAIGDRFLMCCGNLREVNLSGLRNVEEVGICFLGCCASLEELDLSGLRSLTKVKGRDFLWETSPRLINTSDYTPVMLEFLRSTNRIFPAGKISFDYDP